MPYDANWPPDHAELDGAPFRDQFNGLKALIDGLQNQCTDLNNQIQTRPDVGTIESDTSGATLPVAHLNLTVSNPPTQTEIQAIADKLDEMLVYLHRE